MATYLLLTDGGVSKVTAKPKSGILFIGTDHTGKSGKQDGRKYRCIEHPTAGGADDGTFRRNGLRWHAIEGGCDTAADAIGIPVEQRVRAASRSSLSPEQQIEADIAAIQRDVLGA